MPQLKTLCDAIMPILRAYRQKEFYTEPRFHASIAWALLFDANRAKNTAILSATGRSTDKDPSDDVPTISASPQVLHDEEDSLTFSKIPHFPPDMVSKLESEFGPALRSKNVGVFECEYLCVRIGKEVTRWKLEKN